MRVDNLRNPGGDSSRVLSGSFSMNPWNVDCVVDAIEKALQLSQVDLQVCPSPRVCVRVRESVCVRERNFVCVCLCVCVCVCA